MHPTKHIDVRINNNCPLWLSRFRLHPSFILIKLHGILINTQLLKKQCLFIGTKRFYRTSMSSGFTIFDYARSYLPTSRSNDTIRRSRDIGNAIHVEQLRSINKTHSFVH